MNTTVTVGGKYAGTTSTTTTVKRKLRSFYVPKSITSREGINLKRNGLKGVLLRRSARYFTFLTKRRSFTTTRNTVNVTRGTGGIHGGPLHIVLGNLKGSTTRVVTHVGKFACIRARLSCRAKRLGRMFHGTCSRKLHTGIGYCKTGSMMRNIGVV